MPRITRISGSLAVVLIAYWAYALMAAHWIEPPVAPPPVKNAPNNAGPDTVPNLLDLQMEQIKPLFRPGDC